MKFKDLKYTIEERIVMLITKLLSNYNKICNIIIKINELYKEKESNEKFYIKNSDVDELEKILNCKFVNESNLDLGKLNNLAFILGVKEIASHIHTDSNKNVILKGLISLIINNTDYYSIIKYSSKYKAKYCLILKIEKQKKHFYNIFKIAYMNLSSIPGSIVIENYIKKSDILDLIKKIGLSTSFKNKKYSIGGNYSNMKMCIFKMSNRNKKNEEKFSTCSKIIREFNRKLIEFKKKRGFMSKT